MHILWGITGAGFYLKETFEVMSEVSKEHKISICLSRAGSDVVRMYGLFEKMHDITQKIYAGCDYNTSVTKKIYTKFYDLLIIAPCTTNSAAKISKGISDTLVTNIFSDAQKNRVRTLIFPTDQKEVIEITIPFFIKKERCTCSECAAEKSCPTGAAVFKKGIKIDFTKCISCYKCIESCSRGAIERDHPHTIYSKKVDLKNVDDLSHYPSLKILKTPFEIVESIQ